MIQFSRGSVKMVNVLEFQNDAMVYWIVLMEVMRQYVNAYHFNAVITSFDVLMGRALIKQLNVTERRNALIIQVLFSMRHTIISINFNVCYR